MSLVGRAFVVGLATLFGGAAGTSAQTWEVGVKTGLSRAELPSDEFTWSGTPSSSLFLSRSLRGPFAIQPELSYFRRTGVSFVGASSLRLVADYLEVPVLFQAGLRTPGGFRPFVSAGPSFSFRVRCRLQFEGGGINADEDCNEREPQSKVLDVGVAGGGGLAWTLAGTTLSLESRINAGLLRNVLPSDVSDERTMHWSVLAGASIPLGQRRVVPPVWVPPVPRLPLPRLPAEPEGPQVTESRTVTGSARHVTITAENADARAVLLAIAETGGISVVVSPEVNARVTAHLVDIPADEAIQAIVDMTGLSIVRPDAARSAVVFFQTPVDVNRASAETIASRFGVSSELAKFVTDSRPDPKP